MHVYRNKSFIFLVHISDFQFQSTQSNLPACMGIYVDDSDARVHRESSCMQPFGFFSACKSTIQLATCVCAYEHLFICRTK